MRILIFPFAGMAASCGGRSLWGYRTTELFPSKSQIMGMICCALGWPRNDDRIAPLGNRLQVAVRADRPGTICTDYQTIHGQQGPDHMRIRTADGKMRTAKTSGLESHRDYLCDTAFLIAITGSDDDLNMIYHALHDPANLMYLGRKSCVPSIPTIPSFVEYDSVEDALCHVEYSKTYSPQESTVRQAEFDSGVLEDTEACTKAFRFDSVNDFESREYHERPVVRKQLKMAEITYVFD